MEMHVIILSDVIIRCQHQFKCQNLALANVYRIYLRQERADLQYLESVDAYFDDKGHFESIR